jgi:GTP-binding protein HflX
VGVTLPGSRRRDEEENLGELAQLAAAAGAVVVGSTIQSRTRIDGSTYIGEGKIGELARKVHQEAVNLIIFDNDLSPAQARNIENHLNINVLDRTELILDIFARRARTRQARIQVEIAQLTYALPRLRRLWDHLSRQAGGIGTRGPGETQLEVDRRRVRDRLAHLNKELCKISKRVGERRKRRKDSFNVAIAGYTNAGKSTLLNRLSGSKVTESGRLFSTLDSTTRRVRDGKGNSFLLTDTVGFIRKLPAHLVASFQATLMDVREADLILHLLDSSSSRSEDRIAVVNSVLERIFAGSSGGDGPGRDVRGTLPTLLVFNKIDLIEDRAEIDALLRQHPGSVGISAASGEGMEALVSSISAFVERDTVEAEVIVSPGDGKAIASVEELSKVMHRRMENSRMIFDVKVRRRYVSALEKAGKVRLRPAGMP